VLTEKNDRQWISIEDVEDETIWLFDFEFLSSNYSCIYGQGCESISGLKNSTFGCCTFGAHMSDDEDTKKIIKHSKLLTDKEWQNKGISEQRGGPLKVSGEETVTRISNDGCIFLNREDFHSGAGCALHLAALNRDERPIDWKPDVCWQVPIQLDVHENNHGFSTVLVREWKRRDWGEGGQEFHWWCTEEKEAYTSKTTVYVSMKEELIELVGENVYKKLSKHFPTSETNEVSVSLGKKL